jgi:hypothetical protein
MSSPSWIDERAKFQARFDSLSQQNIQGLISDLKKATNNYISTGGLSQDANNNPNYNTILKLTAKAEEIKQGYAMLNDDIIRYLTQHGKNTDLTTILTENGELQKHIKRLEKVLEEMKVDVESAVARDELLRSRNTDITPHKLFLLDRPIRKGMVPYIWALSILFIGVGLVIFRMTMPTFISTSTNAAAGTVATAMTMPGMFLAFFTNKIVLGSLLGSALIVILFLALKIAGVFGK